VVIGSEISGGCRNVFIEQCRMDSPNLERVLRLKSNAMRGGLIENVFLRDTEVGQVASAVLQIDLLYEEGAQGPFPPVVRNIQIEGITVHRTPRVLDIAGFPGAEINNVRVLRSKFEQIQNPDRVTDGADVQLVDCELERN
jgi:unsaturated rhamnogalacturonyl hydrolase